MKNFNGSEMCQPWRLLSLPSAAFSWQAILRVSTLKHRQSHCSGSDNVLCELVQRGLFWFAYIANEAVQMQRFLVNTGAHPVQGYAAGAYKALYIYGNGERSRNPLFDNHSQQILNLKSPGTHWFTGAVAYATKKLSETIAQFDNLVAAEFVIVPSSKAGQVSPGLERVVNALCKADKRLSYKGNPLIRTKSIEKLARGGDRSLHVHLSSLVYTKRPKSPQMKLLLDDVSTTGNSLQAACMLMQQAGENYIVPLVLGKTQ